MHKHNLKASFLPRGVLVLLVAQWWIPGQRGDRNRYLHDSITWCNLLTRIYIHHRYRIWELPTTTTAWSFLLSVVWRSLSLRCHTQSKKRFWVTHKNPSGAIKFYGKMLISDDTLKHQVHLVNFCNLGIRHEEYQGYAHLLMISHSQWAYRFIFLSHLQIRLHEMTDCFPSPSFTGGEGR